MNTIRARIAVILIASITCVVFLATFTTVLIVRKFGTDEFAGIIARQIDVASRLADEARPASDDTVAVTSVPIEGIPRLKMQRQLQGPLLRLGLTRHFVITHLAGEFGATASVELAPGRWLHLPVPDGLEPPWVFLGGWLLLIFIGTTGISLAVAYRVTRPLLLLQTVAADITRDGHLQPVPETGPAEVRATARALNQMSHNLRQAVESRMRLVAAAGHDLRTPMTRMRLRAEFLDEADRAKWLQDLDELDRIADSAIRLVREEVETRGTEIVRLDLMAQDITRELADMKLPVTLGTTAPLRIAGAPLALTRAFRNLIINAAVHGGGAEVAVAESGGRAVVTIQDRGRGIPDHLLDRVFEPFFRVDPSRRQSVPGAGLGLAIAREIIGRAGGELLLANRRCGGLRQEATFPQALP